MARARNFFLAAAGIAIGLWTVGPAAADGLQRFEKSIKTQLPPDALTYKSSKALGDSGFVLEGVTITTPPDPGKDKDKTEPVQVKRITVDDLDFASIEKQAPPLFAKVRFEGVSIGTKPGGGVDLKEMAGLDKLAADFQLDYKLDPERKTFLLSRLELNLAELARLDVSMALDGVSIDDMTQPNAAMDNASLRTASLVYDDHSLLAKMIPIAAAFQGMEPKDMIDVALVVLDGARADQGDKAKAAIDSLVAYIEDYKKPKGELRISFSPPSKVSNADLSAAKSADDMVKLLGLAVSYPGQRTSKPGEAAAAAAAAEAKKGAEKDDDDKDKPLDKKK